MSAFGRIMANEATDCCTPDSTTVEFFETVEQFPPEAETMPPPKERAPMKRKSDEDLRNNEQKRRKGTEETTEEERRVIIMKGGLPQLSLPHGWIALNHRSGGLVYLHKPSRVCTWSRPYHIGVGSVRKHDVPLAAIPCLHQKKGLARECKDEEHLNAARGGDSSTVLSIKGASILNALNVRENHSSQGTPNHDITQQESEKNGLDVVLNLDDTYNGASQSRVMPEGSMPVVNGVKDTDVLLENRSVCVTQWHLNASCTGEKGSSGKIISEELEKPVGEESGSTLSPPLELVDVKELGFYLSKIWEFQSLTSDQEKNAVIIEPQALDGLELPASLECQPYALKSAENAKQAGKDLLLNASRKTPVAILHEYCQRALKTKPVYQSSECENADMPFLAEVQIDGIVYGSGKGPNKKIAKQVAAESTLEVLVPGLFKKALDYQISEAELEFFDKVDIVDPRLPEFCSKTTLPHPSQILEECLKRNQGICPTPIQFTTHCGPDRKLSFKITCGKHEATGPCKNKRIGKQLASQQILKKLHPHLQKWGAVIRIYCDRPTGAIRKYKIDGSQYIKKDVHSGNAQIDNSLLERLKDEMRKLHVESTEKTGNDSQNSPEPVFTVDI